MADKRKAPNEQFKTPSLSDLCEQATGEKLVDKPAAQLLRERFVVPPFSLLNAMQDYWQLRKRAWIELGIESEIGRGENLLKFSDSVRPDGEAYNTRFAAAAIKGDPIKDPELYRKGTFKGYRSRPSNPECTNPQYYYEKNKAPKGKTGFAECNQKTIGEKFGRKQLSATSIFDPVLCELAYRWFCPEQGHVLDPFAGGSVRGITACYLGLDYTGVDLSELQVEANYVQADKILENKKPTWHVGDSLDIKSIAPGGYDLVFSCPPYFDLEVYSDDPRDLSCMTIKGFIEAYRAIIKDSVSMLKDNRFAVWVVGEVRSRDDGGFYQGLVPETIRAFEDAGAGFYNEIILFTAIGTLPVRVNKQFNSGRKIGKAHQNVLVFFKGNPRNIKDIFGGVV